MKIFTVETDEYKSLKQNGLGKACHEFTIFVYSDIAQDYPVAEDKVYSDADAKIAGRKYDASAVVTVKDEFLHACETPESYVRRIYDDYIYDVMYS